MGGVREQISLRQRTGFHSCLFSPQNSLTFVTRPSVLLGHKQTFYFSFHFRRDHKSTLLVSVQFSRSVVSNSFRPYGTAARKASVSITISWSLLKFMSIESVMPSNPLILCHPFLLTPSIFPSIRVFSNGLVLHIRWPKYWRFSFSISSSNEYSGLISFRIDWLDLLAVQGTLKGLLHTTVQKHQFFGAQLSL